MSRYFASLRKMLSAFKAASQVWSAYMKRLKLWKWAAAVVGIFLVVLMMAYFEAYAFQELPKTHLSPLPEIGSLFILILLVVYAYSLILKAISVYLPWPVSLLVTGAVLVFAKLREPLERLLVDYLVYILPSFWKHDFPSIQPVGTCFASVAMNGVTLVFLIGQVWVVMRLGIGLFRYGGDFKESRTYRRWSKPEPTGEEDSSNSSNDGESHDDLPPQRSLTKKQQRIKDRTRRANRAARKARRANR